MVLNVRKLGCLVDTYKSFMSAHGALYTESVYGLNYLVTAEVFLLQAYIIQWWDAEQSLRAAYNVSLADGG